MKQHGVSVSGANSFGALWLLLALQGCSADPTSTPGGAGGAPPAGAGAPNTIAGATGVAGAALPVAGTSSQAGSGVGGSAPVAGSGTNGGMTSVAGATNGGTLGASGTTGTAGTSAAGTTSMAGAAGMATGTGGASGGSPAGGSGGGGAVLPPDQCKGISNGKACPTAGVCSDLKCGILDLGSRECTCATNWSCVSCAFACQATGCVGDPLLEPPATGLAGLDECVGVTEGPAACTQNARCRMGTEMCACGPDDEGMLGWDCTSEPSFWPD